jgi:hypothetical protein
MRFSWKRPLLAILPALALGVAGCSGLRSSHSVSPATFLIPGLLFTPTDTTPAERLDISREPVPQVASVR